ncbi:MAG: Type 1 glutamine amidotransferase-like domain-containing protein [Pseudomonadota bacterium]
MKLILLSGGGPEDNVILLDALSDILHRKQQRSFSQSVQLAFIPADSYGSEHEFAEVVEDFLPWGVDKFLHFPVDLNLPLNKILQKEVFKSDIIFLGGGNTFHFLHTLRKKKLLTPLKDFAQRGGILIGLSAGSIMMTPTIDTASMPAFDRDDNDEHITNFKALNLVDFHFFPHYVGGDRYDRELLRFSRQVKVPLYACTDGGGIVIDEDSFSFYGNMFSFTNGLKIRVRAIF